MQRTIKANYVPKNKVEDFQFGNIESAYSATARYFMKDGKPFLPIFGEIHFSRVEEKDWETELLKMKANGLDGVAIYIFWNHHEREKAVFDFAGNRNVAKFLELCKRHGMAVVLRIGPWCHGEVRYGGFPNWLRFVSGKRKDTPRYLRCVTRYWTALYGEIKEYCDGEVVLGIQLENEYPGKLSHIVTLRKIAEEIGFKTPFFTMTAWPTNAPDKRFLPMMGGYPEAPWTQHKRPLKGAKRFAISAGRTEVEIGEDLNKEKHEKADFSQFPYSGCEVGTGNQVTQHRRPIISDKDGYGIAFAKFASGMNWLGYYMYHGGRNPRGAMLQESRSTFYPNNYPIIDYDFQAPISKDGDVRKHADRLRLLHLFIKTWDSDIAVTKACFSAEKGLPYCSVRVREDGGGYAFIGNYERGEDAEDTPLTMNVSVDGMDAALPQIVVPGGAMFFYPFHFCLDGMKFDYVTAQPITIFRKGSETHCYFMKIAGVEAVISIDGERYSAGSAQEYCTANGTLILHFLAEETALMFYRIGDKPVFASGAVYRKGNAICADIPYGGGMTVDGQKIEIPNKETCGGFDLVKIMRQRLPRNHQLFSSGKREYFALTVDPEVFENSDDVKIIFNFVGLNLQVFSQSELVDDYFNTDGQYIMHINTWRETLKKCNQLIFKASAATRYGVGNVYNEIDMPENEISLKIKEIIQIYHSEVRS